MFICISMGRFVRIDANDLFEKVNIIWMKNTNFFIFLAFSLKGVGGAADVCWGRESIAGWLKDIPWKWVFLEFLEEI